jgi:branched-chain amino acid transport system ATP-binding protein
MLEVTNVAVSYGRHRALEGATLKVDKGEICVILGANGAGKSTLLKTIAGLVRAEPGGEIAINGKTVTTMKAHRIVEEGIALVPEGRGIFGDLTVAENLQLGAFAKRARAHEAVVLAEIFRLFPRLAERKGQTARTMSGGEQQMVVIGRALMSRPDILMLDEPSLGLSPLLSKELFRALAEVAKTGVGILLVEQNAKQSLKIADRGYLIENGQVTGENSAKALMNDPAVINAYLGGGTAAPAASAAGPKITLPPLLRLPLDVAAMGRSLGAFAARAGSIQQAFVRALRRDGDLPSAFVGRYDPKGAADPWAEIATETPAPVVRAVVVSSDARRLGGNAAVLSVRASDRLAAHVASRRLSLPRPTGFALSPAREPAAAPDQGRNDAPRDTAHGLIGHNSAGFTLDAEPMGEISDDKALIRVSFADLAARAASIQAAHVARNRKPLPAPVWTIEPPAVRPNDAIADLVARASSIQAAHTASQRKRLTAYTIPIPPSPKADKTDSAKKKRKKHKEA